MTEPLLTAFEDRRQRTDDAILLHIKELQATVRSIDEKLSQHLEEEEVALAQALANLLKDAFPDGDPDGHRRHHEAVIKKAEESAKFWQEMRVAGAKWAGLGVLGFLVTAAWSHFLQGPK